MLPVWRCPRNPDEGVKSCRVGATGDSKSVAELQSSEWTAIGLSLWPAHPTLPQLDFLKKLLLLKTYVPRELRGLAQGLINILHQPPSLKVLGDFPSPARAHCQPLPRGEEGWAPFAPNGAIMDSLSHRRVLLFRMPCVKVYVLGGLGLKYQD